MSSSNRDKINLTPNASPDGIEVVDLTGTTQDVRGDTEAVLSDSDKTEFLKFRILINQMGNATNKQDVRNIMDELCENDLIAKDNNGRYATMDGETKMVGQMIMDNFHSAMKRLNAELRKNKPENGKRKPDPQKKVQEEKPAKETEVAKPEVKQKPAETNDLIPTYPYGVVMAEFSERGELIKTPEDAERIFKTREDLAGNHPKLVKINAELRAKYNERLAKAKEGISELIDEAMEEVNKANRIKGNSETRGLIEILEYAVKRGVLVKKGKTYMGVDYVEGAKELADAAKERWTEIEQLIEKSKGFSKVAKAKNGFERSNNGLTYAFQIKVIDSPLHRLIKVYNLTPKYPDNLNIFKGAVQDYEGMHVVGNGAPDFLISAADELEKREGGEKFIEFSDSVKKEAEAKIVRESVAEAMAMVDGKEEREAADLGDIFGRIMAATAKRQNTVRKRRQAWDMQEAERSAKRAERKKAKQLKQAKREEERERREGGQHRGQHN